MTHDLNRHLEELLAAGASESELSTHIEICEKCKDVADQLRLDPSEQSAISKEHSTMSLNVSHIPSGTQLGDYKITGMVPLGKGGIAIVYTADKLGLPRREVAVKFLQEKHVAKPDALDLFVQQAKEMAAVQNRHVVKIEDVCVIDSSMKVRKYDGTRLKRGEVPFVVMELVPGFKSIATLVEDKYFASGDEHLNCERIRNVGRQMALGLQAIHDIIMDGRPVIHYDLKPANILWQESVDQGAAGVRINDFGVGCLTLDYAAPELLVAHRERKVVKGTVTSDLYSLGLTFYEMCKKHGPTTSHDGFERGVAADAVNSALQGSPYQEIIRQLLDEAPGRRFQSAKNLCDAIDRVKCCKPWVWMVLSLMFVMAGFGFSFATWRGVTSESQLNSADISLPEPKLQGVAKAQTSKRPQETLDERVKLTNQAWVAFNAGKKLHNSAKHEDASSELNSAIRFALTVIKDFKADAIRMQRELETEFLPLPPVGAVEEPLRTEVMSRGQLNDVAVCLWILGRSSDYLSYFDDARLAYGQSAKLSYARAYDPEQGAFWDPSLKAEDDLATLNESHPSKVLVMAMGPLGWGCLVLAMLCLCGLIWAVRNPCHPLRRLGKRFRRNGTSHREEYSTITA